MIQFDGMEIQKAEATAEPNSILIFGHPKRGKTWLAGSIAEVPGKSKVLHIDLEMGSAPLGRWFPDIDVIRPPRGDSNAVADIINQLKESVDADGYADSGGYDVVILDTVSTLEKWVLDAYNSAHPTKSGKTDFDGWDYWKNYVLDLMWDLHYLTALGISLYHTKVTQNELTKTIWTSPSINGSAKFSVASVPDVVGYLDVNGSGARTFGVVPKTSMQTGNRFEEVLNGVLVDPDMKTIFELIRGGTA